ncbi:MAG: hypothetical protein JWN24_3749 [Phycisphaerales bacterium]|nr:hypothetical protein [Phycisphaerales bacterium]
MRTLQNLAMEAQLDVRPLTLALSPEYEGEGTRAGLRPDRPALSAVEEGGTPASEICGAI